ncbi:major facilitator transporter [Caballeronia arvi]|uniref:Major facilitator transporter n=1 Tax=Caballeronia arvi TaxID=1777135 RepID=A0A158ISR1_9BURK|nr:major facilitator transporter [Caballeronia arvi]
MPSAVLIVAQVASRYRWTVCALRFFATVINYMDRQILGLLAAMLHAAVGSVTGFTTASDLFPRRAIGASPSRSCTCSRRR